MEKELSKSNRDRLVELYLHYNLHKEDDIFRHKKFGYVMITKSGIEKIMAQDQINVDFTPEKIFEDQDGNCKGCIVKATTLKNDVKIETFGTATSANCQSTYYMEMAEKRAKARCVLQLTEFSSVGVFSDVEADEWNQNHKTNQ